MVNSSLRCVGQSRTSFCPLRLLEFSLSLYLLWVICSKTAARFSAQSLYIGHYTACSLDHVLPCLHWAANPPSSPRLLQRCSFWHRWVSANACARILVLPNLEGCLDTIAGIIYTGELSLLKSRWIDRAKDQDSDAVYFSLIENLKDCHWLHKTRLEYTFPFQGCVDLQSL